MRPEIQHLQQILTSSLDGLPPARPVQAFETAFVDYPELLNIQLPERKCHLPWLLEGGLTMVYGPRGLGKTMFSLGLTAALTTGRNFLGWPVLEAVGVLYVDGEMALDELRSRITALLSETPKAPLSFLSGEIVYSRLERDLTLSEDHIRQSIVSILDTRKDLRVLVIDNISCLFPGIDEDKKRDWEPIQAWLISLRRRNLSVVLIHHAGKSGQQRGTSGREDALDTVIQLSRPTDYDAREGCHFELSFNKARSVKGEYVTALDVRLEEINGMPIFTHRPLERSNEARVQELLAEGVTNLREIAETLGISKTYAYKLKKRIEEGGE